LAVPPAPFGGSPNGIVSPPNVPGGPPGTAGGPPALPAGGSANANVGIGNNGTYERGNVPLALGTNYLTVTATDAHGNTTFRVFRTTISRSIVLLGKFLPRKNQFPPARCNTFWVVQDADYPG
jgi:hypothetical protein